MNTIILAENRKLGVDWIAQNIPVNIDTETHRSQTEIRYRNKDAVRSFSKYQQFEAFVGLVGNGLTKNDKLIVVGNVDSAFIDDVVRLYQGRGINVALNHSNGQVLSATELKRKALIQQMADLEKEERLQAFFNTLNLEGVKINRVHIGVSPNSRTFNIAIDGKFE